LESDVRFETTLTFFMIAFILPNLFYLFVVIYFVPRLIYKHYFKDRSAIKISLFVLAYYLFFCGTLTIGPILLYFVKVEPLLRVSNIES